MTASSAGVPRLVVASANVAKAAELVRILAAAHVDILLSSLAEFPGAPGVTETGATFTENALLKAHAIAAHTSLPTVADDSGLCVDALNGMPGVLSARWSGRHGDDEANLRLVLAQVADVPDERLGAQFVCSAVLVVPAGASAASGEQASAGQASQEHVSEGVLRGRLIREPRGDNGFGYDPIFVPDGEQITTAEMSPDAKDRISHRAKALRGLTPAIAALAG
jgi:XTP/dITP diphosphohydrolase